MTAVAVDLGTDYRAQASAVLREAGDLLGMSSCAEVSAWLSEALGRPVAPGDVREWEDGTGSPPPGDVVMAALGVIEAAR